MKYSIIVYIDILGFGNYVLKNPLEDCLAILKLFDTRSSSIRDIAHQLRTYSLDKNETKRVSRFGDSGGGEKSERSTVMKSEVE